MENNTKVIYIFIINTIFIQNSYNYARQGNNFENSMTEFSGSMDTFEKEGTKGLKSFGNFLTNIKDMFSKTEKKLINENDSVGACNEKLNETNNKFNTIYNYINTELNKILQEINNYNKVNSELDKLLTTNYNTNNLDKLLTTNYNTNNLDKLLTTNYNININDLLNKINELRNISFFTNKHIEQLKNELDYMINDCKTSDDIKSFIDHGQFFGKNNKNNNGNMQTYTKQSTNANNSINNKNFNNGINSKNSNTYLDYSNINKNKKYNNNNYNNSNWKKINVRDIADIIKRKNYF